ncbi:hypothetical protein BDZ45DRAFT_668607 [Acephala macrosclerotiorum]|nr:hypothetical protein BDZ45DRAFT_668607 [Acephala macrosclerotiorum]
MLEGGKRPQFAKIRSSCIFAWLCDPIAFYARKFRLEFEIILAAARRGMESWEGVGSVPTTGGDGTPSSPPRTGFDVQATSQNCKLDTPSRLWQNGARYRIGSPREGHAGSRSETIPLHYGRYKLPIMDSENYLLSKSFPVYSQEIDFELGSRCGRSEQDVLVPKLRGKVDKTLSFVRATTSTGSVFCVPANMDVFIPWLGTRIPHCWDRVLPFLMGP